MKRFLGLIAVILIIYVIYFDLTAGTLPVTTKAISKEEMTEETADNAEEKQPTEIAFFKKEVNSGDTVLSIIEEQLNTALPVSIEEAVNDFRDLNKGLEPEKIQYGKTYKFPNYLELLE